MLFCEEHWLIQWLKSASKWFIQCTKLAASHKLSGAALGGSGEAVKCVKCLNLKDSVVCAGLRGSQIHKKAARGQNDQRQVRRADLSM